MNKKRLLSLLLALALSLSCLAVLSSCDGGGNDSSEKQSESENTPGDDTVWYAGLDFDEHLVVSQSVNLYDTTGSIPNAEKYTRGPDKITADKVLNMCYERNRDVAKALGLTVEFKPVNWSYLDINTNLDLLSKKTVSDIDLVINDVIAVTPAMLKGQLYNLKDDAEENYFDFTHECWYNDYINGLTYDESRVYAMAGDYFMDVVRSAHCIYVNTEIFEIQLQDNYASVKDFYQMIKDGEWDFVEFETLIQEGWKSTSGTTDAVLTDEYIGWLTTFGALNGTAYGQEISMIEKNGNTYTMKENTAELDLFTKALCELYHTDGVLEGDSSLVDINGRRQLFTEGRVLFLSNFWLGDLEFPTFFEMDKKAAIIYPKWDLSKEYGTWVHDSAEIGYILTNTATFTPTSAYCQLLNEKSVAVMREYFEEQIKFKQNTDPYAIEMLDMIRDTIASPFEFYLTPTAGNDKIKSGIGILTRDFIPQNNPSAAATHYSSYLPEFRANLANMIAQFNALDD